jgi:hypothetical protein
LGARLWPSHPEVILNRAMAEIGALAARGQAPSPSIVRNLELTARKAPLAPEPYLVKGAVARVQGRDDVAEKLFAQALARDPRSEAVRYLLADLYLHTGRPSQALAEMGVFARLKPSAAPQIASAIAASAKTPRATQHLRQFFKTYPELEPLVLLELAQDASNVELILAVRTRSPQDGPPIWLFPLASQLITKGQFAKAYDTWVMVTGIRRSRGELFNPTFEKLRAPPPFNWRFASSGGAVEPSGDDQLRVTYYGAENAVLAEQWLMLAPGQYQLSMDASGELGGESPIRWALTCLPQTATVLTLPLDRTAGDVRGIFSIGPGCAIQRLELIGSASEFPKSIDFSISRLKLTKVSSR